MIALADILSTIQVVSLPLTIPFRGINVREAALFLGTAGWAEFAPFLEYDDIEAATWLQAAIDFAGQTTPAIVRETIPVNAIVPGVPAEQVAALIPSGCRTAKVKVAAADGTLAEDIARVKAARTTLGAAGRVRIDANGGWNVDEAEHAIHVLAPFDMEYVEQPCATISELIELRQRIKYLDIPIAADESVRKAADPEQVIRAGAADILVLKAAPLGGITRTLQIANTARMSGLSVVISSAIDTSVGLSMGAFLAAALPELQFDCGLGTASLLAADVTREPLWPRDGSILVRRVEVDHQLLSRWAASPQRTSWWRSRVERCYRLLN